MKQPHLPRMIPSRRVAELIGIKTETLANWRYLRKGPAGWKRISRSLVVYPEPEVREWLRQRDEACAAGRAA